MLLLLISFVAGVLTILAPCVLPVLPVIIGGSIGGTGKEKIRPYLIGASLAISIIFFTLVLKVSTVLVNLSPNVLNWLSGALLIGLGVSAALPELWEKLVIQMNWQASSQRLLGKSEHAKGKYVGPLLIGLALGPVFASCSPTYAFILASILPRSFSAGLVYLSVYTIGLVLALVLIAVVGRKSISKFDWAVNTHSAFRRSLGILFIVIGVAVFSGFEIRTETWVANHLPFDETKIERVLLSKQQNKRSFRVDNTVVSNSSVLNVSATPAPELQGLTNWINSSPLTLTQLRGKVVLVDFWTYSCINCIRTLPFIEKWYQTYQSKGLVIIGVNTPEFAFEHNPINVANAVKGFGITYPVTLDNDYATWNAYNNNSWPADYLIDKAGNVRYVSLGEGDYDKTEKAIQELLGINQSIAPSNYTVPITAGQTSETYFGTNRAQNYAGSPSLSNGSANFQFAASLKQGQWTLNGRWNITPEYVTSVDNSSALQFNVSAKDVYMVASVPDGQSSTVGVGLPGTDSGLYGVDAPDGMAVVTGSRLYHIVSLKQFDTTTVTLIVPKGVSLFTFTFGS